jgi:hypothetical protein
MLKMGRKSLALKIYEDCEDIEEEPGTWLVLYDFKGIKPNSKFWDNLGRIKSLAGSGSLIQYSAFQSNSKRGAVMALKIAQHYKAESIMYKVEKVVEV